MGILCTDADGEIVVSGANQAVPSFRRFSVIVRDYRRLSTLSVQVALFAIGYDVASTPQTSPETSPQNSHPGGSPQISSATAKQSLTEAIAGFVTKIVSSGESAGAPDVPASSVFELIKYQSPVGSLAAYVTPDPGDGRKRPAIVWITGGDCNSIGDLWSPHDRSNDQTVSAFRKAGIVVMFPSLRGGNDNPGQREGFLGEVDDILAATDHLARLPYVDPDQIYLGGHSTGGTMVMLAGESSDRFRAVFALGPVAAASQYGGDYIYCDPNNEQEVNLRSPISWLHCVKSPMFVIEGADRGNWDAIQEMVKVNSNPQIQFFKVPGLNHFSVIAPVAEVLADQIIKGQVNLTQDMIQGLR
ncbi:MAG: prolyl oligopeptidase family serine peptidase [Fuerstia sp.]|nr:prolyl oligopeptidase family serine peptidase [Fuerstiella sp.]